ncbi:MAG TPA: hypothetical protein VGP15_19305 [Burkholderiales bacterium]|jgi:hypothetical protein|nr:hypothetical protein [Burkholderiales bacterium]
MADANQWNTLASALRELHRALMDRARRDYEREHLVAVEPGELLQLLTTDPYFEWLRGLSELMVDIDVVRDAEPELMDELSTAVRAAVEHFIAAPVAPAAVAPFTERYLPYLQDDPHVAMAHGAVRQALAAWPRPQNEDAASLLHERHRLAEKARHRSRRR